jgi:hypothetical protein
MIGAELGEYLMMHGDGGAVRLFAFVPPGSYKPLLSDAMIDEPKGGQWSHLNESFKETKTFLW